MVHREIEHAPGEPWRASLTAQEMYSHGVGLIEGHKLSSKIIRTALAMTPIIGYWFAGENYDRSVDPQLAA